MTMLNLKKINVLVVDDMRDFADDIITMSEPPAKFDVKWFSTPMDAWKECPHDWADVLVVDISACGSIMQLEHTYGPILSIQARQASIKTIIINSAVSSSSAEWVQKDIQERLPDLSVQLVDWSECCATKSLLDLLLKLA